MAFVSQRTRQRYLPVLLFFVAIYILFNWILVRKDLDTLNDVDEIIIKPSFQNIHDTEQMHIVEDDTFMHKESLLLAINHEKNLKSTNYETIHGELLDQFAMTDPNYPRSMEIPVLMNPILEMEKQTTVPTRYHPLDEMKPDLHQEDVLLNLFFPTVAQTTARFIRKITDYYKGGFAQDLHQTELVHAQEPTLEMGLNYAEESILPITLQLIKSTLNSESKDLYTTPIDFANPNLVTNPTKNPAFIVDTSGCRIPKLDPWDPTVLQFIELLDPLICSDRPLFMTPQPNGIIHLDKQVLQQYYNSTPETISCIYQEVRRNVTLESIREDKIYLKPPKDLVFDTVMKEDYVAVRCDLSNGDAHEQYMPLTRLKKKVEDEKSKIKPSTPLNVILYGIDSISKLNFFRHFRQTQEFLKERMNIFDMKGYTKVADNTFPNLTPMLTGHFVDYYWNESMADTYFFDNMNMIWKDYSKHGYRTFFAEDKPLDGAFNYYRRGFFEKPTDYYYRPIALMIEGSTVRNEAKQRNSTCLNSELEMDLINDFLKNFVKTMDGRPYFAFTMHSTLTHDLLNYASYTDAPTVRLLKALDDSGALNNTIIVMFSDHGIRYGSLRFTYIGKFEERMPFMYIHVPEWFLKQHPEIKRNLILNQDRLMTLFDIHATLKHILNLDQDPSADSDEYGLSLFSEIPENRTCEDANIQQHWCPCANFEPVPLNDTAVANAARAMVTHINELLKPHWDVCSTLELLEVTDALRGLPNDIVLKFVGHQGIVENARIAIGPKPPTLGDYLITVKTQPGNAMFEGTVRYNEVKNFSQVMDVSRINMYGRQSWCIDSVRLKLYCYCKTQIS